MLELCLFPFSGHFLLIRLHYLFLVDSVGGGYGKFPVLVLLVILQLISDNLSSINPGGV